MAATPLFIAVEGVMVTVLLAESYVLVVAMAVPGVPKLSVNNPTLAGLVTELAPLLPSVVFISTLKVNLIGALIG